MSALEVLTKFTATDKVSKVTKKMAGSVKTFSSKAEKSMARAQRSTRAFSNSANKLSGKIFNLRNAAVALGATMVFKKMYDGVTATAKLGDEAAKSAAAFGITAEALQEYQFAADRSGVSSSIFESSMLALVKRTGELKAQSGGLYSYLNKTGQTALMNQLKSANSTGEAMEILTKRMGEIESPTERAALANAAFSRSGIKMVNMMKDGTEGINAMREQARKYGGVISDEAAAKSEEFIDAQTNMNFAMRGLTTTIGTSLMPKVQSIVEGITSWIGSNQELIKSKVTEWANKFAGALEWVKENSGTLISVFKWVSIALVGVKLAAIGSRVALTLLSIAQWVARGVTFAYNVALGLNTLAMGKNFLAIKGNIVAMKSARLALLAKVGVMKVVTAAQWLWNAAMSANPIGLIIIAVIALIGLIVAIIAKWEDWGAAVSLFMGPVGMVISLFMELKKRWDDITSAFSNGGILAGLKMIGKTILSALLAPVEQLLGAVGKIPGMSWATEAAANMNNFREGMFPGSDAEEEKKQQPPEEEVPNTDRERYNAALNRQMKNANIDLNVNDQRNSTDIDSDSDMININRMPTFAF